MKNEEYERLLSPSPAEFIIMFLEGLAGLLWRISRLQPTETIARLLGHGYYPDRSQLPEWNFNPDKAEETFRILHDQHIQQEADGIAVYDGVVYGNAKTIKREEWENEVLTQKEIAALHSYNPPLLNAALAKQVKYYLKKGHTDHEIAVLSRYKEKTIQHYRLALQKASLKS